jgi:hypothetical protein
MLVLSSVAPTAGPSGARTNGLPDSMAAIGDSITTAGNAGARMRDAAAQAQRAVSPGVEYVTFLMGANVVCTSSTHTMTSGG